MLECFELAESGNSSALQVALDYEQRQKSRGSANLANGEKVAWFLPRGQVLANGDCLRAHDGQLVQVVAAPEKLSEVATDNALLLTRAAYHLGNRHVPLQIQGNTLSYQHDHVLDAMVLGLGLPVNCVDKPFHPEPGAYHSHSGHSHSHNHDH